ncbi:MAG: hypothetical protein ACREXY_04675 [Gammaproteobacteria bacterium]
MNNKTMTRSLRLDPAKLRDLAEEWPEPHRDEIMASRLREGQDLIDQVLRPVRRRHHVAEVALEIAACGHGVERHLRIPQDGTLVLTRWSNFPCDTARAAV